MDTEHFDAFHSVHKSADNELLLRSEIAGTFHHMVTLTWVFNLLHGLVSKGKIALFVTSRIKR